MFLEQPTVCTQSHDDGMHVCMQEVLEVSVSYLICHGGINTSLDLSHKLLLVVADATSCTSKSECWTNDQRIATDLCCNGKGLLYGASCATAGTKDTTSTVLGQHNNRSHSIPTTSNLRHTYGCTQMSQDQGACSTVLSEGLTRDPVQPAGQ